MEEKIIGIVKDIGEFIVAVVVEDTEEYVVVKNPAFLGINGQDGQVNINFIPVEMLSVNPPVNIKNFVKDSTQDLTFKFMKNNVLKCDIELSDSVVENYKKLTTPKSPVSLDGVEQTEDKVVKLF